MVKAAIVYVINMHSQPTYHPNTAAKKVSNYSHLHGAVGFTSYIAQLCGSTTFKHTIWHITCIVTNLAAPTQYHSNPGPQNPHKRNHWPHSATQILNWQGSPIKSKRPAQRIPGPYRAYYCHGNVCLHVGKKPTSN